MRITRSVAALGTTVSCATIACSGLFTRQRELTRPISAEAATLAFVGDSDNRGRVGGAVYHGNGNAIVFDLTSGSQPTVTKLHVSRFSSTGWSAPRPAIPGFDVWHAGAQVSPDGTRLYFESTHRLQPVPGREDSDLWVANRAADAWVNPRPLGPPFDSPDNEHNVTISASGTICINSNRRGITAGHDILCSRRSASGWEAPRPLGAPVNGASAEIAPFIDPDERFLLFASNRAGGAGMFDLYVSVYRDGEWQPAVNLGPRVNTPAAESNPALSRDGRRLLFSRSSGDRAVPQEIRFDPRWLQH